MLTARQQLKFAILHKCAEAGLSPEETLELVKTAADSLEKDAGVFGSTLSGIGSALKYGLPVLGLGAAGVGAAGGYALGQLGDVSDEQIAEEKKRELIDAYRNATDRVQRSQRTSRRRAARPQAARSLV